jgi:hypothetical protein
VAYYDHRHSGIDETNIFQVIKAVEGETSTVAIALPFKWFLSSFRLLTVFLRCFNPPGNYIKMCSHVARIQIQLPDK